MDPQQVAGIFNARARGYVHDDWHRRYAEALVAATPLRDGDRVLDAGTGTGFAACAIARRVGRRGHVLAVDISPGMLEQARILINDAQLANVECREADAAGLRELPAATFDAVVCSAGLLYMDVPRALRAWHRLLRRNGVVAFSTMRAGSPSAGRVFRECAARFGVALTDPSEPLGTEDRCARALEAAGFERVHMISERVDFQALDPALAWEANSRSAGAALGALNAGQQDALRQAYLDALTHAIQGDAAAAARAEVIFAMGHARAAPRA